MKKTLFIDFVIITALAFFHYYLLQDHLDFLFIDESGKYRGLALFLSIAPLFSFYFLMRALVPCLVAGALAAAVTLLLTKISNIKQALTIAPLSWTDITRTDNLSVVPHYISQHHVIYALLALIVILALFRIDSTLRLKKIGLLLAVLFGLISAHPYLDSIDNKASRLARFELTRQDVRYIAWDWPLNIRKNGLLVHLIQTSQRKIPPPPSESEKLQFELLKKKPTTTAAHPSNIIIILCEACWHNDQYFKKIFDPLVGLGFKPFRAISPVYGGGTVNSSFELLTGLPANGALNGIIYQEYTQLLSSQSWSWPRSLENKGYASISLHNHFRHFWNRDIINEKLGFRKFISLEDMNYDGPIWADDEILFKSASKELTNKKNPKFEFITTVYTHGGYSSKNGDNGENEYEKKLTKSIIAVKNFAQETIAQNPDSLILLVGDHKPAMTRFFHQKNIFSDDFFIHTKSKRQDYIFSPSAPKEKIGDVPGYIYYQNQDLSTRLNNQPFFCLTQIVNEATTQAVLPAFQYAQHKDICSQQSTLTYQQRSDSYPSWLYSASLF